AAVITTGPGVIIATATASTNWRSVSQWNFATTTPYKNGTIANPLPNTKAPAFKKKRNRTPTVAIDARPNIAIAPHSKKSHTISDLVQAVVIASAVKIAHRSQSLPTVPRTSLIALRTMIAITAAPIP